MASRRGSGCQGCVTSRSRTGDDPLGTAGQLQRLIQFSHVLWPGFYVAFTERKACESAASGGSMQRVAGPEASDWSGTWGKG